MKIFAMFTRIGQRTRTIAPCLAAVLLLAAPSTAQDPAGSDPTYYLKRASWCKTFKASWEAWMVRESIRGAGVPLPDFGASDFTFLAWIRTKSQSGVLLAKAPAEGNWAPQGKALFLRGGRLHYDVGWVGAIDSGAEVDDGKWHHVVFAGNAPFDFYVDGEKVLTASMKSATGKRIGPDVPGHQFKIGYCTPDFPDGGGFEGEMDEFLLFKRRLSSKEVETIFRGRETIRDGLVGHYPFDGNAWDVSGNGLHGERKGVGAGSGKYGGAFRFDGEHAVLLPESPRMAARTRLWNLIARDFPGKENAKEIAWEREDGIWEKNWLDGAEGVQELGRRYAAACRFHGTPNDRVGMLSEPMKTEEDLQSIREVYLFSRRFEAVYTAVREKVAWMKEEILYLDDKYDPTNERWKNYKAEVAALAHDAEAVAGRMGMGLDGGAIVTLEKLKETADRLNAALPVTFPSGPAGPGRFGAFYTRLKYTLAWDRRWRVGPLADVVVRFDTSPVRLVFWRGTSYIPCWVTENGIWYTNEFCETWGGGTEGCAEPMSDKQTRYSHVRVIESHPARAVVHWRYALCDVEYRIPHPDPMTGWGDWVDEYYTLYPDGVAVRAITISSSQLDQWHEFQEAIVLNQPSTRPEDNIALAAITLANLDGQSIDYLWTAEGAPPFGDLAGACIQVIHLNAKHRPFTIVPPEGAAITPYRGHAPHSHFNCWDHWPVSMDKNWTRVVKGFDRPSHTSLSHVTWPAWRETETSSTRLLLNGMTEKAARDLVPLARSWLNPPRLELLEGKAQGAESLGYDPAQRAYVLAMRGPGMPARLAFRVNATKESPLINPAIVVKGWGRFGAALAINGKAIEKGEGFCLGHCPGFDSQDLILWIKDRMSSPVEFTVIPNDS